jgi:hypothetical protein
MKYVIHTAELAAILTGVLGLTITLAALLGVDVGTMGGM